MKLDFDKKYLGGYREDVIDTDTLAMEFAKNAAKKSLDPSTQVGACIVKNGVIISVGYNRPPKKWDKDKFPWGRDVEKNGRENTKYPYIIHAEMDAISKCKVFVPGSTLYVTLFPCSECAKLISAFDIKEVVYGEIRDDIDSICSKRTLTNSGIEFRKFETKIKKVKVLTK